MTSVLHIITGLGAGGAETMLVQLATALQDEGMPQHVASLTGGGVNSDALQAAGVGVTEFRFDSALKRVGDLTRLGLLVRRLRPDVIQGWMYHGNLAASAARKMARGRPRLMWNIRASNMDEERYGRIIRWNARLSHGPDVVLTNSHASIDFHKDCGFAPRRTMVIHNGVDVEKYKPDRDVRTVVRAELGIDTDARVAAIVARVDPMKDYRSFCSALESLPQVTGLLVGLGTQELNLPENAIAVGLRHDVDCIHQAADLIVSSSAFGEGFSNALAEGMSSGLIPVATDVGDASLIVGETGRIVPPGSPELLAAAIEAEAMPDADVRQKRGLAARQRIVENFTLERAVEHFHRLYEAEATRT